MRPLYALLVFLLCGGCPLSGQQAPATPAPQISSAFLRSTVASIQSLIQEHYFKTAAIPRINAALETALVQGDYAKAQNVQQLAALLTTTLGQASQDKHLFVTAVAPAGAPPPERQLSRVEGARLSNYSIRRAEVLDGNVGYLKVTGFYRSGEGEGEALDQAMKFVSHADALILDLRENAGGSPDTAVQLLSYFFAQPDLPFFRVVPRSGEVVTYKATAAGAAPPDEKRPVYVLVSGHTWSAGEGVAFFLQERHRAIIVGERTAGAGNPAGPWPVNPALTVTIPFGEIQSAVQGRNWDGTGVIPDIASSPQQTFQVAYVQALEVLMQRSNGAPEQRMLAAALAQAKSSTCDAK